MKISDIIRKICGLRLDIDVLRYLPYYMRECSGWLKYWLADLLSLEYEDKDCWWEE